MIGLTINSRPPPASPAAQLNSLAHWDACSLQAHLLENVSRTFALTIPRLPAELCKIVGNAYLLCRTVDTIEDEPALAAEEKLRYIEAFVEVVKGKRDSAALAAALAPRLSETTIAGEHELIWNMAPVVAVTHGFSGTQREILENCVATMADGMVNFQLNKTVRGLADMQAMNAYCYYVAGVVGEMLTRLFCAYSPAIEQHRAELMHLGVSFGQGLQMTNILKDIWDDLDRSACWLPREVFVREGFDLERLREMHRDPRFARALGVLIGIAHGHLDRALAYVKLIPPCETGIRRFCLWAIGMALLTLRKINRNRGFSDGNEVKITRWSVRATVIVTELTMRSDLLLKSAFNIARMNLPQPLSKP